MPHEDTSAALASILSNLAKTPHPTTAHDGSSLAKISLPGADTIEKRTLESELNSLAARIHYLESRVTPTPDSLPVTPGESSSLTSFPGLTSIPSSPRSSVVASRQRSASQVNNILAKNEHDSAQAPRQLTGEQLDVLREHVNQQAEQIRSQQLFIDGITSQLQLHEEATKAVVAGHANTSSIEQLQREIEKNVQINATYRKVLKEIGTIITAVANGDLSMKVLISEQEKDPEITRFKQVINRLIDQLQVFASELSFVARETGIEGRLGAQAVVPGVAGVWSTIVSEVNSMSTSLTYQVREIAVVSDAVLRGDLSKTISWPAKGEILQVQQTINKMMDQLRRFATEISRVSREVGTEGVLGGQAQIEGVEGMWAVLQETVNAMAHNLTSQVRDIAAVTLAVAKGDLTQKVKAECKGEILELKNGINNMTSQLATFASEVSRVAHDVGTLGRLGGQVHVEGVSGKWKDLTMNVNSLLDRLTSQVRSISSVTQAIARGVLNRKIEVDAQGEIETLKDTINDMTSRLDAWSLSVEAVARDVGIDGKLGGEADTSNISGRWKETTIAVNQMAANLTSQVRAFGEISEAATKGNFSKTITVEASGEMNELKQRINTMIYGLRESIHRNNQQREAAELANKTKSEFLANMSHEIRTPMNGIIGMTQLTLDTELEQNQRDMLSTVFSLANSLLTIIDDILDISKIEANRMILEEEPFSLRGLVFSSLKSLAVRANEKEINLMYDIDGSVPDFVVGDSFRMRQIILNLAGNALKFTDHGEVRVKIGADHSVPCGEGEVVVKIAVSDTGIGIHADKLDIIFDTFQQADGSTTRRFGGTGLGLSISRRLVTLMRGRMWVESVYGEGSTFFFTCVVRVGTPDLSKLAPALSQYRKHKVLFIDTGKTGCAHEIVEGVRALDLEPTLIGSGAPSDELDPEAVFDVVMVDSSEAAQKLRTTERFKLVPMVVLAPAISASFKHALENGISSYMTTPCQPIDLGNALIPALESRAAPSSMDHSKSFDILLAEDNAVNQKLAVKILTKHNHKVTVANNGLEALEAVKKKRFNVVLMDVQMPVMGGFEATAKIREYERLYGLTRTPIIALTAHAMLGDREKCIQAQMDEYLSKPLKPNMLIQQILKCGTLGGALLEHKNSDGRYQIGEDLNNNNAAAPSAARGTLSVPERPNMNIRGYTETRPAGLESPALLTADLDDPMSARGIFDRANSS